MVNRLALTDADIVSCYSVYRQLRLDVVEDEFLEQVRRMQATGFQMALRGNQHQIVSAAGFRIYENFFSGRHLYVDDLVTDASLRSEGHGSALLQWLIAYAKEQHCRSFQLDSGTQRHGAHKFYLREGMHISSFHFSLSLTTES